MGTGKQPKEYQCIGIDTLLGLLKEAYKGECESGAPTLAMLAGTYLVGLSEYQLKNYSGKVNNADARYPIGQSTVYALNRIRNERYQRILKLHEAKQWDRELLELACRVDASKRVLTACQEYLERGIENTCISLGVEGWTLDGCVDRALALYSMEKPGKAPGETAYDVYEKSLYEPMMREWSQAVQAIALSTTVLLQKRCKDEDSSRARFRLQEMVDGTSEPVATETNLIDSNQLEKVAAEIRRSLGKEQGAGRSPSRVSTLPSAKAGRSAGAALPSSSPSLLMYVLTAAIGGRIDSLSWPDSLNRTMGTDATPPKSSNLPFSGEAGGLTPVELLLRLMPLDFERLCRDRLECEPMALLHAQAVEHVTRTMGWYLTHDSGHAFRIMCDRCDAFMQYGFGSRLDEGTTFIEGCLMQQCAASGGDRQALQATAGAIRDFASSRPARHGRPGRKLAALLAASIIGFDRPGLLRQVFDQPEVLRS